MKPDGVPRFLAFLMAFCLLALTRAASAAPEDIGYKPAMRGVFVDAFGTQYRDQLSASRLVRDLARFDVQHAFLQVCVLGEGFYKSETLPRASGLPAGYDDPLGSILEMAKEAGDQPLSIHAWISPLQTHNARAILPPPPGHVGLEHPDWLTEDVEGNQADVYGWQYLDPGHPAAQDYVVSIVREIVEQYDVAGIYVEGLQYPENGSRFGYNKTALERYQRETGATGRPDPHDPAWSDWRRRQLTSLAARIAATIKERKPEMIYTAGVIASDAAPKNLEGFSYSETYVERMQDWPGWARDGITDWICLLNFKDEPTQGAQFDGWTAFGLEAKHDCALWIGVAGYRNWAIDAFSQVRRVRMTQADGVAIHNFRQPVRDIAVTEDFFAAVRGVTLLAQYDLPGFAEEALLPQALQERLDRMRQMSRPGDFEAPGAGLAPGIEDLPPTSPPPTRPGMAPVSIEETTPGELSLEDVMPEGGDATTVSSGDDFRALPFLDPWDTIYLTNRSVFQGHKLGEVNGESIFQTASGVIIKIGNHHVERIQRDGRE